MSMHSPVACMQAANLASICSSPEVCEHRRGRICTFVYVRRRLVAFLSLDNPVTRGILLCTAGRHGEYIYRKRSHLIWQYFSPPEAPLLCLRTYPSHISALTAGSPLPSPLPVLTCLTQTSRHNLWPTDNVESRRVAVA